MNQIKTEPPGGHWWPGRISAIISAVLTVLACPLLAVTAWAFVSILLSHRPDDRPGYQRDEDYGIGVAIAYMYGVVLLWIAGALLIAAAGLFLRPGLRSHVMYTVFGLMVALPIVEILAVRLK